MRILVLGGIRSGKSEWAESVDRASVGAERPVRYLATGPSPTMTHWAARVSAHRARRPQHWSTVETADVAKQLRAEDALADAGRRHRRLAHRGDGPRGAWTGGSVRADVDDLLDAVARYPADLVLVSPEVGLTVVPADRRRAAGSPTNSARSTSGWPSCATAWCWWSPDSRSP